MLAIDTLNVSRVTKDGSDVIVLDVVEDALMDTGDQQVAPTKADLYTTTVGSYVAWETDVNLDPPFPDLPIPPEDRTIRNYYDALEYTLYETGYPETESRLNSPRRTKKDRVTIAVLSSPVECMGTLLEGGRQCPGDMLLVLSPTWMSRRKSTDKSGLYSLYVHKAITFESAGRSYLDLYNPPRRVTYFMNFFTRGCTDGARADGEELEVDLDCPMSSSLQLCRMIDDKLFTRMLMSEVGSILYPETLAFTYCSSLSYDVTSASGDLSYISLDSKQGVENVIRDEVTKFVQQPALLKHDRVVVKPSGIMWHASIGVTYHARDDIDSIYEAVMALLAQLEEEDVILVEAFYHTIYPLIANPLKWGASKKHAARVRSTVCRGSDNLAHMTKIVCGVGSKKDPVNGDNTIPQSLDTTLLMMGVIDETQRNEVHEKIKDDSEKLLRHIMDREAQMTDGQKGGAGAQTDVIGIDFILAEVGGVVTPISIEVNSHDCMINCQLYEFMYPQSAGEAFRRQVENMISRSQGFLVHGKKILVIGAGGYSKRFIWEAARNWGIKIILVESDANHFAANMVSEFVVYDLSDHTLDNVHARNIIQLLVSRNITINGCITFWEDCGPLAAEICDLLNLTGPGLKGALAAKKKSTTQQLLQTRVGDIPHWPRTYLYTSEVHHISSSSDIEVASQKIDFPCVLKLEYGSSACGVILVNDAEECEKEWNKIQEELHGENSHPGIGLGHGKSMMMMDYIQGTEHDVDLIIYQRKLIVAFVSDNGPTRVPRFTETAAAMPSFLPYDKRRQLTVAAYQCCVEVGLVSGVFNVELKMTTHGPRLIEINARMGGFYLRDWIRTLYGVDTLLSAFMIAADIRPYLPADPHCCGQLVGVMVVPSAHRHILTDPEKMLLLKTMEDDGVIQVNRLEENVPPPDEDAFEEPYANIAVLDPDPEAAKRKLLGILNSLGVNSTDYPVEEFLSDFRSS